MNLYFFYGTLKRDLLNYLAYVRPMIETQQAEFVCSAKTIIKYPMIHFSDRKIPAVYNNPNDEGSKSIIGEVWRISENAAKGLDIIEGIKEGFYCTGYCDVINIDNDDNEIIKDTRIYFKGNNPSEYIQESKEFLSEYKLKYNTNEYLGEYTIEHHNSYTLNPVLTETLAYACNKPLELIEKIADDYNFTQNDRVDSIRSDLTNNNNESNIGNINTTNNEKLKERSQEIADFYKQILDKN